MIIIQLILLIVLAGIALTFITAVFRLISEALIRIIAFLTLINASRIFDVIQLLLGI